MSSICNDSGNSDDISKDRARARWKILRQALLGNQQPKSNRNEVKDHENSVSIHRFSGFQMLSQRLISSHIDDDDIISFHKSLKLVFFSDTIMKQIRADLIDYALREMNEASLQCNLVLHELGHKILVNATALFHFEYTGCKAHFLKSHSSSPSALAYIHMELSCFHLYESDLINVIKYLINQGLCTYSNNAQNIVSEPIPNTEHVKVKIRVAVSNIIKNQASACTYSCFQFNIPVPNSIASFSRNGAINQNIKPCDTSPCLSLLSSSSTLLVCVRQPNFINSSHPSNINVNLKVDLKALMSQSHYGVDNTGNTRIWDSESLLTFCLFSGETKRPMLNLHQIVTLAVPIPIQHTLNNKMKFKDDDANVTSKQQDKILNIVELGAGMAGLAGLALAALKFSNQSHLCENKDSELQRIKMNVVITDGHPDSVFSNEVNATMTQSIYNHKAHNNNDHLVDSLYDSHDMSNQIDQRKKIIQCRRLLWNIHKEGADECKQVRKQCLPQFENSSSSYFQLCLVSDCLHFQEFHASLAATIGRLLSIDGICILCQPTRGKSTENFKALIQQMNSTSKLFQMDYIQDYHPILSKLNEQYIKEIPDQYDPSIHYPHMILLKKLRDYDERTDSASAINAMKEREQHTLRNSGV